jgi:uncharacterized membrane protein YphA (DoxX/SURF4 family)
VSRSRLVAYWVTTAIVALILLSGGFFQVIHQTGAVEGITSLGYPTYFVTILGVWKILGGIVLLAPRTPRLKEWAYAGAIFDLTGAALSHAAHDGSVGHVVWPLALAALAVASWALRPESRIVGTLLQGSRT